MALRSHAWVQQNLGSNWIMQSQQPENNDGGNYGVDNDSDDVSPNELSTPDLISLYLSKQESDNMAFQDTTLGQGSSTKYSYFSKNTMPATLSPTTDSIG
ncbi:hypothetical protein RMATCC62417_11537 [Rhizopus microsporus]|nr:hypothetical protein RMATCC62417_11537 [Rhizopus microsporus]